eukprot:31276-Rhodomonas_salina.1
MVDLFRWVPGSSAVHARSPAVIISCLSFLLVPGSSAVHTRTLDCLVIAAHCSCLYSVAMLDALSVTARLSCSPV